MFSEINQFQTDKYHVFYHMHQPIYNKVQEWNDHIEIGLSILPKAYTLVELWPSHFELNIMIIGKLTP